LTPSPGKSSANDSNRPVSARRILAEPPRGEKAPNSGGVTDRAILAGYLSDASGIVGSAERLYRPQSEADLAAILREAHSTNTPVTVVAGQTSTTAASVPDGGWVLSMEELDKVLMVDLGSCRARAQAGVCLGEFQDRVESSGLFYPPDPTSRYECSLGGSVACNASGPRSLRYGATRSWVRGLRVVLVCGDVLEVRRGETVAELDARIEVVHSIDSGCARMQTSAEDSSRTFSTHLPTPGFAGPVGVKSAAGFWGGARVDLVDLFIGSEGTLGVVTEIEVDLLKRPRDWLTMMVFFPNEGRALDLIEASRRREPSEQRAVPDCLEWFDRASLDLISADQLNFEVPQTAEVALIIEQGIPCGLEDESPILADWVELLGTHGAMDEFLFVAQTEDQREALRRARHAVPVGVNQRAADNRMPKLGTDFSVPDSKLRETLSLYHQAARDPFNLLGDAGVRDLWLGLGLTEPVDRNINIEDWREAGLPDTLESVAFGHIGDNHLHVNFLPQEPRAEVLARAVYTHLAARVIEFGGSPSAEHGIGKTKHASLRQLVGDSGIKEMQTLKRALDPRSILGRGNLFFSLDVEDRDGP
jgi:D-lactate dehydrogenase (cytochrome)